MYWKTCYKLLALVILLIVTVNIALGNDRRAEIVIFPFKSNTDLYNLIQGTEDVMRSELVRSGYFTVVEQERTYEFVKEAVLYNFIKIEDVDVETALPRASIIDLFARFDSKTVIRVAEKVKADFAIKGSLNQFGEKFRADIEVLHVKGKETLSALVGECESKEEIPEIIEELSQQIINVCKGANVLKEIDSIQGNYQQGNLTYKEAADRLKSLSLEMPDSFPVRYALFLHYLGHQEVLDSLIEEGEGVISLFNPDNEAHIRYLSFSGIDPFFELANVYCTMGRLDSAIRVYNLAILVYPMNHTKYYKQLGLLYKRTGKTELAINAFKQALKINPSDYEIRLTLAITYETVDDILNAMEQYQHCLKYAKNTSEGLKVKDAIKRLQSKK